MKVSVIVPVYNTEKYLGQCLDSICAQTLKDIEIICVDDGSTDSSPEILARYQAKDERIQVYTQENKYAGAARNLGKSHASGEYLAFWDSDDFFEPEALELLYNKAKEQNADICVCGANKYFEDRDQFHHNDSAYLNKNLLPKEPVFNRESHPEIILNFTNAIPWNKLFRRKFIEDIKLDFQEIRNCNDLYFTVNALCMADRITTVDRALVNYRLNRDEGLVSTVSRSPLSAFDAWTATEENLQRHGVFPEQSYVNRALSSTIYILRNMREYSAFEEAVLYLKNGALDRMHIIEGRGDDFYYAEWQGEFVSHIWNDTPQELLAYLAYTSYTQLLEKAMERQLEGDKINDLKQSRSYRTGRAITWLLRKMRDVFKGR